MNDQQFHEFMKKFDSIMSQKLDAFRSEMKNDFREELSDIRGNIDWMVGALDTDEKERMAIIYGNERKFKNHETRISKLELAITPK